MSLEWLLGLVWFGLVGLVYMVVRFPFSDAEKLLEGSTINLDLIYILFKGWGFSEAVKGNLGSCVGILPN